MYKALVVGEKDTVKYWIDKLNAMSLPGLVFTSEVGAVDINIIIGHEKYIFSLDYKSYVKLKWIQLLSAGLSDSKNLLLMNEKIITTSKGIHGQSMFEYILYGLLHLNNKTSFEQSNFLDWKRERRSLTFNNYQKVLLLGCGNIGSYLCDKFSSFGMTIDAYVRRNRTIKNTRFVYESLDAISLHKYDFIISSLPITDETKKLLDYNFFHNLSKSCIFINVGRGETVCEEALEHALINKNIKGAILDTFSVEPVDPLSFRLHRHDNCICTPHISGFFNNSHDLFLEKFCRSFELFKTGELESELSGDY